jgi:Na+/phosphate symporter
VQQHLPQQEIQRTGLPVQVLSSTANDTLNIPTIVQQIMTELSEAVSEKDKIMSVTKMVLTQQNGCYSL